MSCEYASNILGWDYDHYDPAFALDPHAIYAELRAKCPVSYTENYGGFFVLTTYADVDNVLHQPEIFSSFPADTPPTPGHTRPLIPFEVDPPDHLRYRRIVDPYFGPKLVKLIEPAVRSNARLLIEAMCSRDEFDFISEFARPFPSSVFLEMVGLGVEPEQRDQLCAWTDSVLHAGADSAEADRDHLSEVRIEAGRALHGFLKELLEARIETRGEDVISILLDAEFGGERNLSHAEILNFAYVLVLAGLDTVTTALGFSFLHLGRRPDLRRQIAGELTLIPSAVEEFLRFEPIVHASRTVTKSHTLGGVALQPGDRIVLPLASVHRDKEMFEQADEIILDRTPNRHIAFGTGIHRCLGSHLARLELRVAFEELFRRMPNFEVPEGVEIRAQGGQTRSLSSLPVRLTPS